MLFKTLSAAVYGIDASLVEVEVDVSGIRTPEDHFVTHHKKLDYRQEFLAFLKKHKIDYDPRYIWD